MRPASALGSPLVEVMELRRSYGALEAVRGVSFDVRAGEVLGLLGPNGAGKTTLISILSTALRPSSGHARICGHDVLEERRTVERLIGLVPQELAIYPRLSAAENLRFFGRIYGLEGTTLEARVDELLRAVGLEGRRSDEAGTYSGGMKRRLNLATSLVHGPRVVMLDEPTVGIDPQSREHIFGLVRALAEGGAAVIYTTHLMEEAERLADRLAILDEGRLVALGTLEALLVEAAHLPRPPERPRLDALFFRLTGRALRD